MDTNTQNCCFLVENTPCASVATHTLVEPGHPYEPTYSCVQHVGEMCSATGETRVFPGIEP